MTPLVHGLQVPARALKDVGIAAHSHPVHADLRVAWVQVNATGAGSARIEGTVAALADLRTRFMAEKSSSCHAAARRLRAYLRGAGWVEAQ